MCDQPNNKTLLVIGYVWPEPNSSAAGSHMLSILRLFRDKGWRVVFSTPAQDSPHRIALAAEQIEEQKILLNDNSFDEFVAALNPQLVIFDRFMMEEQFAWRVEQACPQAMRILDSEDLQSLRHARQQALKVGRKMTQSDLFSDLARREIAAILRSDLTLVISEFEMLLLQQTFSVNSALIHHLPFMLSGTRPPGAQKSFSERQHFVTIGNFRHAPNWDSVLFLQQIWPQIRKRLPRTELHIYGAYPPKKATVLNNPATGFLVKGWAEDAMTVLSGARVCLSPLRFGAGIKGKFADAMLANTPSVTTEIGAEGMCGDLAWPGIIADEPAAIVDAAVSLYTDETLWTEKQQAIEPVLKQRFDAKRLGDELMIRVNKIQSELSQHRENNFIGSMLNYHSNKSTYFMSKWIETKNRLAAIKSQQ